MNKISGAEYPIKKIFSNEFDFVIPSYQRPYAWTTDQAGVLFDDLWEFMQTQDENEAYFLGSIVLIKQETQSHAEVIDGQQRLTTLAILLSAISWELDGKRQESFANYVNEPGNEAEDLPPKPRLALRERDKDFFHKYIQKFQFKDLLENDAVNLTDSQKNIRDNAEMFLIKLKEICNSSKEKIFEFGKFIVNRCYLVAVSTATMQSAYRIFSVLNDRGLDLLPSDLLKADIIGKLPEYQRDKYTDIWEEWEEDLGRDGFNDLFAHIRMIYMKAKAKKTILEELKGSIFPQFTNTASFVDDVLVPYAEAYQIILNAAFQSSQDATKINNLINWLLKIDNSDWIPPAILFLTNHKTDTVVVEKFFEKLEQLAASMFIRRLSVNERLDRYSKILTAIENKENLYPGKSLLDLSPKEILDTLAVISGDVYLMPIRPRTYLLLRLDSFISDKAAVYDNRILSVEHVLPQTVDGNQYWKNHWPDEDVRAEWTHKLGNLLLLSRRKNSQAQNYDFKTKKEKYFSSKAGISSFALTTKVLEYAEWTPEVVSKRQEEMIEAIREGWDWK